VPLVFGSSICEDLRSSIELSDHALATEGKACVFPHNAEYWSGMAGGENKSRDAHHCAVQDHETDLVIGQFAAEAFAQLRNTKRASDKDRTSRNADRYENGQPSPKGRCISLGTNIEYLQIKNRRKGRDFRRYMLF
jgi:hypothetical protein